MNKKALWKVLSVILLVIIAIPLVFLYVLNNGNPYTKYLADKNVPIYLEKQGYTENDLEESHYTEPKYTIDNEFYQGHYMTIFKDEPNVTYYYGITKEGKQIKQFCEKDKESSDGVTETIEDNTKHSEENCANSL